MYGLDRQLFSSIKESFRTFSSKVWKVNVIQVETQWSVSMLYDIDGNPLVGFHPLYLAINPPDNIDCPYTNSILVQKDWAGKIVFTRIGVERISQVNAV